MREGLGNGATSHLFALRARDNALKSPTTMLEFMQYMQHYLELNEGHETALRAAIQKVLNKLDLRSKINDKKGLNLDKGDRKDLRYHQVFFLVKNEVYPWA